MVDDGAAPATAGGSPRPGSVRLEVPGHLPHVVGEHVGIQESHVYADIMHLVDCLAQGTKPLVTGAHARHVVELIEKGYESSRTGKALDLRTTF